MIIFTPNILEPLYKVPEGGGAPEKITETKPGWTNRNPYFLPDGDHYLFNVRDTSAIHRPRVRYSAPRSRARNRIKSWNAHRTSSIRRDTCSTSGKRCWWRSASIRNRCKFSGDPKPVAEKLDYWNARDLIAFTAAHGTLVFRHGSLQKTQPMWVDGNGKGTGSVWRSRTLFVAVSFPDGSLVGLVRTDPDTGRGDIWIADTKRTTMSRSTFVDGANISYAFSPDAKKIAVATVLGATSGGIWIQATNGSGAQEKLETPQHPGAVTSWSPNGRYLF